MDASEEELKALFSKQRGYKRLVFRTKANGPMCFAEFEDVSFATKALNDLYGYSLSNSEKDGIRLSFSKNPLGVRGAPAPTQMKNQHTNLDSSSSVSAETTLHPSQEQDEADFKVKEQSTFAAQLAQLPEGWQVQAYMRGKADELSHLIDQGGRPVSNK